MLVWGVEPFVVGDKAPRRWVSAGSEQGLRRTLLRALAAHLIRAGLRAVNVRRAWRELGVEWVHPTLDLASGPSMAG